MKPNIFKGYIKWLLLIMTVTIVGCSPTIQAPLSTQTIAPAVVLATNTSAPTNTPLPAPTDTPQPTSTATPLPTATLIPEMLNAWCMPPEYAGKLVDYTSDPSMPAGANQATNENGKMNLKVPADNCTWLFTSNQPMAAGALIEFYQPKTKDPWLKLPLSPVKDHPNEGVGSTNHPYIVNPPFWEVTYPYAIIMADGTIKSEGEMRIYKVLPPLCWNGTLPNPITLYCPSVDGDWNVGIPETYERTKH